MMNKFTYIAPCHFGLESVLAGEIKRIGGENVTSSDGKITFTGDINMVVRANFQLRTAERVMIKLSEFKAETFDQLFEGTKKINFEDYISKNDAFPVKGHSLNSKLYSIPDCQKIIKKAAVERLKQHHKTNWFEETGALYQIQFSIMKDNVIIMLDTSGAGLHKRGYRSNSNIAPIKETLAAGIIDLARVRHNSTVYDPFCGSGTFVIESALKALGIPSGIKRKFICENWKIIPKNIWKEERERAMSFVKHDAEFKAFGSDIDPAAIKLSLENARISGTVARMNMFVKDIKNFKMDSGIVICNPPYGERMLEIRAAEEIYREMGKVFTPGDKKSYYIISPHEDFEQLFGRKATKRRKLYNGMIKCQLFMYF